MTNKSAISITNHYAFGYEMGGRAFSTNTYRYDFYGKENDEETGTQDYGFRIYNPMIAKFLSVDPLTDENPGVTNPCKKGAVKTK